MRLRSEISGSVTTLCQAESARALRETYGARVATVAAVKRGINWFGRLVTPQNDSDPLSVTGRIIKLPRFRITAQLNRCNPAQVNRPGQPEANNVLEM